MPSNPGTPVEEHEVRRVSYGESSESDAVVDSEPLETEYPNDEGLASEGQDEGDISVDLEGQGISLDKNDRSLSEFYRWYQRGRLIVDPEWQREYVVKPRGRA